MLIIFLKTSAIFLMILAGYVVRRRKLVDDAFNRQLSLVLMNVFYPALILNAVVRHYTLGSLAANWALPAGTVIIVAVGWSVGMLLRPFLHHEPEGLQRTFLFHCTMNNYSFLPIMLVTGLMGEQAVAQVILASFGAEICLWTLGVQALTGHAVSLRTLRNLLTMPMGALVLAVALLACRAWGVRHGCDSAHLPATAKVAGETALSACQMIGQATVPVSAIICGCRMAALEAEHLLTRPMLGIVLLRLAAIPALVIPLLSLLPLAPAARAVLMVVSVQPVSMASVYMAEVYNADARFAAAGVLATHAICLISIPIWLHFLI